MIHRTTTLTFTAGQQGLGHRVPQRFQKNEERASHLGNEIHVDGHGSIPRSEPGHPTEGYHPQDEDLHTGGHERAPLPHPCDNDENLAQQPHSTGNENTDRPHEKRRHKRDEERQRKAQPTRHGRPGTAPEHANEIGDVLRETQKDDYLFHFDATTTKA